jgi:hypothetical protein
MSVTSIQSRKAPKVSHIERSTETPSSRTGCFATLRGVRHRGGSGAPSVRGRLTVTVLGVVLCLVLLAPSGASARFVRPFLRQITGPCEKTEELPPSCPGSELIPFNRPEAVAVDGEGDLWVRETQEYKTNEYRTILDEFGPSSAFLRSLTLEEAESVKGAPVHALEGYAVDESTNPLDPSAGDLYAKGSVSGRQGSGTTALEKFNAAGEARDWESFKGSEACECHVAGNAIVFESGKADYETDAVAVDPTDGDIWFRVNKTVFEFNPRGEIIREIGPEGGPSLGGESFGSEVYGLAVDPTNGDLLVALTAAFTEAAGQRTAGAVDEFNAEGAFLGEITEAGGVSFSGAYQMAVGAGGDLYVVNHAYYFESGDLGGGTDAVDEFEAGHFVPGLRAAAATRHGPSSAVLNGFVDPESELNPERVGGELVGVVECRFEYVSEAAYQKSGFEDLSSGGKAPCEDPGAAGIPKDDAYTPVHAEVREHIESGVTYRYRLSATTGGLLGGVEHGAPVAFTAAHAPAVSATAASGVTSTFARLSGDVDPFGADTTYQFQYLTEAQFNANGGSFAGAAVAPAAPVDIGSGGEAGDLVEAVSEPLGGLAPGTTYRFRLVASNEVGVSKGEEGAEGEVAHTFTTEPAVVSGLPDGRAYELVTPPDKEGGEDLFRESSIKDTSEDEGVASESGDQFLLQTRTAFGSFPASGGNLYVFSRHPAVGDPAREEWGYTSLASPALGLQNLGTGLGAVEPGDFSRVAVTDQVGAPASEAGMAVTTLLGPPGGPYATLHTDQSNHVSDITNSFTGAGPEERTVVEGASRDMGVVLLRSTDPALAEGGLCKGDLCVEHPLLEHPIPYLYEWSGGGFTRLDGEGSGESIGACGAALGNGISFGEREDAEDGAVSADGSKVFFTAPAPGVASAGVKGCHVPSEVYVRSAEETIEVSAPEADAPEATAHYEAGFRGATEDGSRVFFTSEGELTANDAGIHDVELYEYDTETRKLTRVSAGASGDAAGDVVPFGETIVGICCSHVPGIVVSSDGSRVYFTGRGVLASANAEGKAPVAGENNVYVYEPQTGRTAFIATVPSGARHFEYEPEASLDGRYLLFQGRGSCELERYDADTESLVCVVSEFVLPPSFMRDTDQRSFPPHAMADDGSVFFNTAASLVPQATNGVTDVYEWHEGKISLLSSGQDSLPSFFLGASPDGANVFFGTHARLVTADTGGGGNVYDARVCTTAEPCIAPSPAREGLCEGDACSHPAAAPSDATPGSATSSGQGDLTPPPPTTPRAKTCAKPKKLSKGRCVAVKAKRRKPKAKTKAKGRKASAGRATRSDGGGRSR